MIKVLFYLSIGIIRYLSLALVGATLFCSWRLLWRREEWGATNALTGYVHSKHRKEVVWVFEELKEQFLWEQEICQIIDRTKN